MGFKLDDDTENLIIQHADEIDANLFWIGDLTRDLVDELSPHGIKKSEIRQAVALAARWRPETIRDKEWVSRQIPESKRTYELGFHQLRACLAAGDRWEEFAQRAVTSADDYAGRTAPVAVIRDWIRGEHAEVPRWRVWWDKVVGLAERILEETDVPEWMQIACKMIVGAEGTK